MNQPDAYEPIHVPFVSEGLAPTGGALRARPEDFRVDEVPAYAPSGHGEHLYLRIEKTSLTTDEVAGALARTAGVPKSEIGYAGQKDRHAVTTQWFSAPFAPAERAGLPDRLAREGVRVLAASRHTNRLKTGHLAGNRFRVRLRGAPPEALARAEAIAAVLRERGLANAFGPQRFGAGGATARAGLALLADPKRGPGARDRYRRRLHLSAAQAWIFNRYLRDRIADGLLHRALPGDVARRTDTGGLFVVEDVAEAQARLDRGAIVTAGPIVGRKTFPARDEAAAREARLLEAVGVTPDSFAPFGKLALGTRRANVVRVDDIAVEADDEGLVLAFALPSGSYATMVLREFVKEEVR